MDWAINFALTAGKTYRFRYVDYGDDRVKEAVLRYGGEVRSGNRPVLLMLPDDVVTLPGMIQILQIDEMSAEGEIVR